ncbi:Uu.00g028400.m01.CDS01 [Anthostomella pinea]|uniref:Uu.00g028400.m01.CDS01 n=1 Tax=Anthostomella pinea TaxID=933095 RepID=A0AAI8V8E8_9PEZI|nr:Uu.00g028400.m01.CDS01 [Anthostomella pinea]
MPSPGAGGLEVKDTAIKLGGEPSISSEVRDTTVVSTTAHPRNIPATVEVKGHYRGVNYGASPYYPMLVSLLSSPEISGHQFERLEASQHALNGLTSNGADINAKGPASDVATMFMGFVKGAWELLALKGGPEKYADPPTLYMIAFLKEVDTSKRTSLLDTKYPLLTHGVFHISETTTNAMELKTTRAVRATRTRTRAAKVAMAAATAVLKANATSTLVAEIDSRLWNNGHCRVGILNEHPRGKLAGLLPDEAVTAVVAHYRNNPHWRVIAYDIKKVNKPPVDAAEQYLKRYEIDRRSIYIGGLPSDVTNLDEIIEAAARQYRRDQGSAEVLEAIIQATHTSDGDIGSETEWVQSVIAHGVHHQIQTKTAEFGGIDGLLKLEDGFENARMELVERRL